MNFKLFLNNQTHYRSVFILSFMLGIIFYFALPFEPSLIWVLLGLVGFIFSCIFMKHLSFLKFLCICIAFFLLGIFVPTIHSVFNPTKMLTQVHKNVFVTGVVEQIEQKPTYTRVVLKDIEISNMNKKDVPQKIRLNFNPNYVVNSKEKTKSIQWNKSVNLKELAEKLAGQKEPSKHISTDTYLAIKPETPNVQKNDLIRGFVYKLRPPYSRIAEGDYFSRRAMWFEGIGGLGSFSSVEIVQPNKQKKEILDRVRLFLKNKIDETFSIETKGIAEALILGNQNGLLSSATELYRILGLSHILSVSGFHVSLIAFFVFIVCRILFSLIPSFGHKKAFFFKRISALVALFITFLYVIIAGSAPPAVRAFIMVFFVFGCFFINRRALSLRSVSIAAFILLCLKPDLVLSASFQLSFIAVLGLVVLVEWCGSKEKMNKIMAFFMGLFLLNIVATCVTLPFLAYHFHQISIYGIIGNLLLSFIFSIAIMPLLGLGVLFSLFDIGSQFFKLADYILLHIQHLAEIVSILPYTVVPCPSFHAWGLVLFSTGVILICVLCGKIRFIGLGFILCSFLSFLSVEKPEVYIGQGGNVIAHRQQDGTLRLTESWWYRYITNKWLLMNGEKPQDYNDSSFFKPTELNVQDKKISFSPDTCEKADYVFEFEKGDYTKCKGKTYFSKEYMDLYGPVLVYKTPLGINVKFMGNEDKERPWGLKQVN